MAFRRPEECAAIEARARAAIDSLRAEVVRYDPDPIIPGDQYAGGDLWDGCFVGRALAINDKHVALWSKISGRVAIVPHLRLPTVPELGKAYAITSWGSRIRTITRVGTPYVVNGRETIYDWLDAMDDYIIALQQEVSFDSLLLNGVHPRGMFVLRARRTGAVDVASWYRELAGEDLVAYAERIL